MKRKINDEDFKRKVIKEIKVSLKVLYGCVIGESFIKFSITELTNFDNFHLSESNFNVK